MKEREISTKERLVKVCLWLTILFYWISGVLLMCFGVSAQMKLHDALVVVNEAISGVSVTVTVVGTIIVLVSTFGAIALLKYSSKMLKLFTGMLLAVLLTELIVGASAYTYRKKLHQTLLRGFLKTLDKYDEELQISKGVDSLQRQFQCCGATNYTDWLNTTFGSLSSSVPTSCCKVSVESCVTDLDKDAMDINQQGCVLKLKKWVEEHIAAIEGIGIFIGLVQITGILFCFLLLGILKETYASLE
ncbi:tetraspanin-6-like [Hemicordylus capensis]|uniref:tetraspanin-6-like n=1 Tax=Hemicordylus capensis TaxID=884348 RepID=UPI002303AFF0|nr:tetraspanin-6-like [Hemicordylus capensis]